MKTLSEAQKRLPELIEEAQKEAIGLLDERGNLVGLLAGLSDDVLDDLVVQTPAFQNMIARSRASLAAGEPVAARELLAEARARLAKERKAK
jgi:hypothetical protein